MSSPNHEYTRSTSARNKYSRTEPSETPGIGIVSVKSRTFWASIPGIGIGIVGSEKPRPVSVSVPFNILDWDQSRYRSRSISQTGTSLGIGLVQYLWLRLVSVSVPFKIQGLIRIYFVALNLRFLIFNLIWKSRHLSMIKYLSSCINICRLVDLSISQSTKY